MKKILCLIGIGVIVFCPCRKRRDFTYDLTQWERVPASEICYRETKNITLTVSSCGGIAVREDTIYLTGDNLLFFFNMEGTLLKSIVLPTAAACLAVSDTGNLYLGLGDSIGVYDTEGRELDVWASLGNTALLTSLAVSGDRVYAADAGNRLVYCYTNTGRLLLLIDGKTPEEEEGFLVPSPYFDLIPGADNTLWVVNPGRYRLEQYTQDGKRLVCRGKNSMDMDGFSGCCNPIHITRLPDGNIVTAEKGMPRVKVLDTEGRLVCVAAAPDQFRGSSRITDLAATEEGGILILDSTPPALRFFKQEARYAQKDG